MDRYKLRIKEYTQRDGEKYYTVDIMQKFKIFWFEFWIRYWSPHVMENGSTTVSYQIAGTFDTEEQAREIGKTAMQRLIKSKQEVKDEEIVSTRILE